MRSRLADYQILGPAGPAGDTWLASAPSRLGAGGPVVLTELPADTGWADVRERLTALASVRSHFLPPLLEAGRTDEEDGTVTWVVRGDGRPTASTGGPAPDPAAILRRLAAAARGAHDLHEAGWVHGDIRPRSILERGEDGLLEPPVRPGPVPGPGADPADLGTLEPASIWGEGPSRATDVWALGATAHLLLTGRSVHPALADDGIVTAVQRVLIEAPVLDPALPAAVGDLLRACLATDPADRPATAAALADGFEQAAAAR